MSAWFDEIHSEDFGTVQKINHEPPRRSPSTSLLEFQNQILKSADSEWESGIIGRAKKRGEHI
jgi:hypothetical protein